MAKEGKLKLKSLKEFLDEVSNYLYLLSIYNKSDIDSISDKEITRILKELKRY